MLPYTAGSVQESIPRNNSGLDGYDNRAGELMLLLLLYNETDAYKSDSYEVCIEAISESNIHPLFCAAHRDHSLPVLIMEYVHVRYYFESKRYKNLHFSKSNRQCITDDKKKKSE